MPHLRTFTFDYDEQRDDWYLKNDLTGRVARRFDTKAEGTKGGEFEAVLGSEGGSVRIHKVHGGIQEERTYPGDRDPYPPKG